MRLKTDSRTNVKRYVAELIIMHETDVIKKPRCWDTHRSWFTSIFIGRNLEYWRMSEEGRFVLVEEDDPIHSERVFIAAFPCLATTVIILYQ